MVGFDATAPDGNGQTPDGNRDATEPEPTG
jgi:hypothetical protein